MVAAADNDVPTLADNKLSSSESFTSCFGKQEFLNPQHFPFATDVWWASYRRGQMISHHMNSTADDSGVRLARTAADAHHRICTAFFSRAEPLWGHKAHVKPQATT